MTPTDAELEALVERVAAAIAQALRDDCVHLGKSYAVVDSGICWQDGTWGAEVDGEIDLLPLARAAIAAMPD